MYQICSLTSLAGKGGVDSFRLGGGEQRRRSLLVLCASHYRRQYQTFQASVVISTSFEIGGFLNMLTRSIQRVEPLIIKPLKTPKAKPHNDQKRLC